ncbi:MAG TPA: galactose oxidase-like domain-containing protein [Actinophytocola sp.]|nr:galactose oxidase-like domain-containing protein [Actinophytocola sp.]
MLTGALVTGAGLLAPNVAAADPQPPEQNHLDVPRSMLRVKPDRLSLTIDDTVAPPVLGDAMPLLISTTSPGTTTVKVSSTTGGTTVGSHRDTGQAQSVDVRVTADAPATVWVVPRKIGRHSVPGDWIVVSDGRASVRVAAWIEPVGGRWVPAGPNETPLDLGIVAIHAALVRGRNGPEVMMYSPPRERDENGELKRRPNADGVTKEIWVWDVDDMTGLEARTLDLTTLTTEDTYPNTGNIFCSGASHLPDGRVLIAGGHVHAAEGHDSNGRHLHIYDPKASSRWARVGTQMGYVRWYPTVTPLPDGRMLIVGGSYEGLWNDEYFNAIHNNYAIYHPDDNKVIYHTPLVAAKMIKNAPLATYPGVFVLPGKDGGTVIAVIETNRAWLHKYQTGEPLEQVGGVRAMTTKGSRSYPWYGSTVLLPLHPGRTTMGILAVGGAVETSTLYTNTTSKEAQTQPATATADLLQLDLSKPLDGATGTWKRLDALRARFLCDATLLADGTVLVTGGASNGWANYNSNPVNEAVLFDPENNKFRSAATAFTPRRYHSVALLLPDGTLLKAGSTGGFGGPPRGQDEGSSNDNAWFLSRTDAERYLPPYLWRGPRPSIELVLPVTGPDADTTLYYDQPFTLLVTGASLDASAKVALIRLGAATHGNNMEQRYVYLDVPNRSQVGDTWYIDALPPDNQAAAPPGDYMLVVVDSSGVPSEARLVRLANEPS